MILVAPETLRMKPVAKPIPTNDPISSPKAAHIHPLNIPMLDKTTTNRSSTAVITARYLQNRRGKRTFSGQAALLKDGLRSVTGSRPRNVLFNIESRKTAVTAIIMIRMHNHADILHMFI